VAQAAAAPPLGAIGGAACEIFGTVDLGGVLNDFEVVPLGQVQDRVHIHGVAIDMDGHNGLKTSIAAFLLCHFPFDLFPHRLHVHAPGAGVAIHKNGNTAVIDDSLGT